MNAKQLLLNPKTRVTICLAEIAPGCYWGRWTCDYDSGEFEFRADLDTDEQ